MDLPPDCHWLSVNQRRVMLGLPKLADPEADLIVPEWGYEGVRPIDATDPSTFDRWCQQPDYDTRTLNEFAADGGKPMFPPNRHERGRRIVPTGNTGTR